MKLCPTCNENEVRHGGECYRCHSARHRGNEPEGMADIREWRHLLEGWNAIARAAQNRPANVARLWR